MKTALISFTENGRILSRKIGGDRFCFVKHSDPYAQTFSDINGLTAGLFNDYEALVFICAAGIAVRAVAPYIRSKLTDPAVVVIDDNGKFVISLLSGHLGGANALARQIAAILDAVPVITTATDSHGLFSPDMFAKTNGLVICDMQAAKLIASAVVNGEKVGFCSGYPYSGLPAELSESESGSIGICVSGNADEKPFDVTLNLVPANIIIGIGCKRGTTSDTITKHIMTVFSEKRLDIRRIRGVATIDIKSDEPGLAEFCENFGLSLETYSADELMSAPGEFEHSDFVERTTGADNVCERAAVCAGGKIIVTKSAGNGVTVAAAELPVFIDFERNGE